MNSADDRSKEFDAKQYAAIDALAAVVEDPQTAEFPQRRDALVAALAWLEVGILCTACLEDRCDENGPRHEASVAARQRRARLAGAGLLP